MGIFTFLLLILAVLFMLTASSSAEDDEEDADALKFVTNDTQEDTQMNLLSNLTREKKQNDLEIETAEKEYNILINYDCFCGAEGSKQNFPDVYINFIYELDEKGTRWFNNKEYHDDDNIKGYFSFKVKFPLYKKKNGKDRQQFAIQFYDQDPWSQDDHLGSVGKYDLSKAVKDGKISTTPRGGELEQCNNDAANSFGCYFDEAPSVVITIY